LFPPSSKHSNVQILDVEKPGLGFFAGKSRKSKSNIRVSPHFDSARQLHTKCMTKLVEAKRVIQSKDTKLYLKPNGRWTRNYDAAADFKTLADVRSTCEAHELRGVELVLKYPQREWATRFSLGL
jgi:hypothetical protein